MSQPWRGCWLPARRTGTTRRLRTTRRHRRLKRLPVTRRSRSERALAALFVPVLSAVTVAAVLVVVGLGVSARDRARIGTVADVSALAAVTGGSAAAAGVASANGARLESLEVQGRTSTVVVTGAGHRAVASAAPDAPG